MRNILFSKYHGCGNDFILVRGRDVDAGDICVRLARAVCDRHVGVGADGLIVVREDPLEMEIYNSDGSRAPMCGNGIRCFAQYCRDEGIVPQERTEYSVRTLAGDMRVRVLCEAPFSVEINMGRPDFNPAKLGIVGQGAREDFLRQAVTVDGRTVEVSSVFVGTVHTVVWLGAGGSPGAEDLLAEDAAIRESCEALRFGEKLSELPLFSGKTNVNMAKIIDEDTVELVTWERGAGLTAACGTGASAVAVIGALEGRLNRSVEVLLPYGALNIRIADSGEVFMAGPSVRIATGTYDFQSLL
ncbi:MAG: diaminopimelate epimerase [Clostridiales Family XIII bacterium]|jgi:diaminopimelate epimerase|nr:diaminopimelate epimerase [Clostridiales Family XIII bacterium]